MTSPWRKSSYSNTYGGCIEVAEPDWFWGGFDGIAVRDSKNPAAGRIVFTRGAWRAFLRRVKDGAA